MYAITSSPKRNPITWVPSVYFAMGLPYVTLSTVTTIMYKDLGVGTAEITRWTSLLILPWSLKPLFSLVMELFGTKRQYVYITELITSVMFALVCFSLPLPYFFSLSLALMGVIGISGAMHDIAGDGIYMQELTAKEQGVYGGWQGAFYNLAKILANGALVYLVGVLTPHWGILSSWMVIMGIFAALMLGLSLYNMWALPKEKNRPEPKDFQASVQELKNIVVSFFTKKYIWLYLIFALCYRLAEGFAIKIAPIFLKDPVSQGGLGLSNQDYGLIYGTAGSVAFVLGSILSGYYVSYFSLKKVLFSLVCIYNIPFAVYLLLAITTPSLLWITVGIVFEYFSYGAGAVGLTLFIMQQVAPGKYQMAHYAFANSLTNLAIMLPGYVSGELQESMGYKSFFVMVILMTLPAILLGLRLPFAHDPESKGMQVEN